MNSGIGLPNVDKLTENNYGTWKVHMKSILVCNDPWTYVRGTEECPEQNPQQWLKKDSKALAIIQLCVSPGQLNYVKKAETSKQAWDSLKEAFEASGPVRKVINDFTGIVDRLTEAGLTVPEELLSIMLLSSLSEEYENFCIAMESKDDVLTMVLPRVKREKLTKLLNLH